MNNNFSEPRHLSTNVEIAKKPNTLIKLISVITAVFVVGIVTFGAIGFLSKDYGDRNSYKTLQKEITENYESHLVPLKEDPIAKTMPQNEATTKYRKTYLSEITKLQNSMIEKAETEITNDDFESVLNTYRIDYENLKTTFNSGASFRNDQDDQSMNFDDEINENTIGASSYYLKLEKEAREIVVPDGLADYRAIGEKVAKVFDVKAEYGFDKVLEACNVKNDSSLDLKKTLGLFCTNEIYTIYFNDSEDMKHNYSSPFLVDTFKHELAHHLIYQICGTTRPSVAEGQHEKVTSSFAVIFLGADHDMLQLVGSDIHDYKMTDESHRIARNIHDNSNCYAS